MYKCRNFKIYELVSEQVYRKYGEKAWEFFDPRLLKTIDWLREELGLAIIINDWYWSSSNDPFDERGFRCNLDTLIKEKTLKDIIYCTPHGRGMAVDFNVKGMTAKQIFNWLKKNQDRLPFPLRLEDDDVERTHIDVIDKGVKLYIFKP